MKELKGNLNKWIDIVYSWIGIFRMVKVLIHIKLTFRFNVIPLKSSQGFLWNRQFILKFI